MTSIKLYEVGYDESEQAYGSVTIMMGLHNSGFFLIREGIPAEDGEDIDDPGIEISDKDMEAFCRAALSYIERKTAPAEPAQAQEPGPETIKICDVVLPIRTYNCIVAAFTGGRYGWEEIDRNEVTLGDVCRHTRSDYMKLRNFGRKSLYELENMLGEYGLKLKN